MLEHFDFDQEWNDKLGQLVNLSEIFLERFSDEQLHAECADPRDSASSRMILIAYESGFDLRELYLPRKTD